MNGQQKLHPSKGDNPWIWP